MSIEPAGSPMQTAEVAPCPSERGRQQRFVAADQPILLLCEPNSALVEGVTRVCEDGFLLVEACSTASDLLFLAGRLRPALVLMRADLPDADAVIATLRRHDDIPVVVSVGEGETLLAGPALFAGASELTEHPYRDDVLRSLVQRQLSTITTQRRLAARLQVGALVLDGPAYSASVHGRQLQLPRLEFDLLRLLMDRAGRVVSYDEISDTVWKPRGESVTRQTVSVHMSRLRENVADAAEISAIRGVGYRLSA